MKTYRQFYEDANLSTDLAGHTAMVPISNDRQTSIKYTYKYHKICDKCGNAIKKYVGRYPLKCPNCSQLPKAKAKSL